MIITRAPFRVSFCGGGSDIPSFYLKHGGCVLSTSIRKYMYLTLHQSFDPSEIVLKYSQTEIVHSYDEIKHNYFRQVLKDMNVHGVEITSMADIPAGTGLGSSSSFTVALLHLLHTYKGEFVSKYQLANDACDVEINQLGNPIGKQDQFAAAFGGLNFIEFKMNGYVDVQPVVMKPESYRQLQHNLLMFYLGGTHSASAILKEQTDSMKKDDVDGTKAQLQMCDIARELKEQLEKNNIDAMGELMDENWQLKKTLATGISNPLIDETYDKAMKNGATGGKLLGAGGAGFMLFYVPEDRQASVREALSNLREMEFKMDNSGSSIIHVEHDNVD